MLTIIIFSLFIGTCNASTLSSPTRTASLLEEPNDEKQTTRIEMVNEDRENQQESYSFQYTINFSKEDLNFDTFQGYDIVTMKECSYLTEYGKPQLPAKRLLIALPDGMKVTDVRILSLQKQTIQGFYTIYPAQRPQKLGENPASTLDLQLNRAAYLSPLPYPERLVRGGKQTDLAGQSMIEITVFPLQYLPLQKQLSIITSITLTIEGSNGYICGDYLSEHLSETGYDMYQQMVKNMVVNPENV